MNKRDLMDQLKKLHKKHYGQAPVVVSFAPGRAEVLGNHTDYNLGTVLSTAIDRGHCFAISPNQGKGIRLLAGDLEQIAEFDLETIGPVEGAGWASYVRGVFYYLREKGLEIKDWDCSFLGSIPIGSGLSSSAALEVSSAYAAQEFADQWIDPIETARLCQASEQKFAGCNCGLLDQFSSIYGEEHCLIHSDFRNLKVSPVKIPEDIQFLIITPQITHSLVDSPYNARRESCEQAARELDSLLPHKVETLRDVSPAEFEKHRESLEKEASLRAAHIVGEIDRVARGVKALETGDVPLFGDLMYRSHESSRVLFENSSPELDEVVEAAWEAGALGARLSGGGWGGSLIALIREGQGSELSEKIGEICSKKGLKLKFQLVLPSEGAEILQKKENL